MTLRIGIPLIQPELNGRSGWIAGFHFIKNCLYAIALQSKYPIPEIIVFIPEHFNKQQLMIKNEYPEWLNIVEIEEENLEDINQHETIEKIIDSYHCDIFFPILSFPKFLLKGRTIGWIADFQDRHLKNFFSKDEIYYRELAADFITSFCDKMLCTSQAVLSDFKNFYPSLTEKSSLIHFRSFISDSFLASDPHTVLKKLNIERPYIYLPNQFWKHKNHKTVFEAWHQLQQNGHDYLLVCTGSSEDYRFPEYYQELTDYIRKNNLQTNIKLLGLVDRDNQIQLYRAASAILQPSLFEGWNTSIEEAKALGKPIIASNLAVHQEQCGESAIFFNPHSSEELAQAINSHFTAQNSTYSIAKEQLALKTYQKQIEQFGVQLIELFSEANQLPTPPNYPLLRLPIFLSRRLTAREYDCEERLRSMNQLEADLNKILLERPSFLKRMINFLMNPKTMMTKIKRIWRIYGADSKRS